MFLDNAGAGRLRDIDELSLSIVAIKDGPILVVDVDPKPIRFREDGPVYQQQSLPATIVDVEESAAPTHEARIERHAGSKRDIVELSSAAIVVQRFAFVRKV